METLLEVAQKRKVKTRRLYVPQTLNVKCPRCEARMLKTRAQKIVAPKRNRPARRIHYKKPDVAVRRFRRCERS